MEIKLNLLSEVKKNEVRRKKRYLFIVWQEVVFIFFVLFYGGILTGIYYMHDFHLQNLKSSISSSEQTHAFQEIQFAENIFQDVNQDIADTKRFQQEHTVWSNFFIALDKAIPKGILLNKIATADRNISLGGTADTRESLLLFQDALNTSNCFRNPRVPLSDLFTQTNIDFQLDIEIKKECLKPGNI